MIHPFTAEQFLQRGLEIACSAELHLGRLKQEAKLRKFKSFYVIDPSVMEAVWTELQTTPFDPIEEDMVPQHLLLVYYWFTSYESEDKLHSRFALPVKQVIREVLDSLTGKLANLRRAKVST